MNVKWLLHSLGFDFPVFDFKTLEDFFLLLSMTFIMMPAALDSI